MLRQVQLSLRISLWLINKTLIYDEEEKIDMKMAAVLKKIQKEKYEREMKTLDNLKNTKGRSAVNFSLEEAKSIKFLGDFVTINVHGSVH